MEKWNDITFLIKAKPVAHSCGELFYRLCAFFDGVGVFGVFIEVLMQPFCHKGYAIDAFIFNLPCNLGEEEFCTLMSFQRFSALCDNCFDNRDRCTPELF